MCTGAFSRIWPCDLVSEPMWPSFEHDFYSVEANILNQFYEEHVETIIYSSFFLSFNLVTYFWLPITQFGTWPYWANLWLNMYPPILRIHLKIDQQRLIYWFLCDVFVFFILNFFIKHMLRVLIWTASTWMQFKWEPTTYAFIKK